MNLKELRNEGQAHEVGGKEAAWGNSLRNGFPVLFLNINGRATVGSEKVRKMLTGQ
ncbi:MAG: hypothetical protein AABZ06_02100 [Bdellovibrionota bacterium]